MNISGRKKIIAEFKALVSSLPQDMGIMQSELGKYKEAASELHSLRAEVQSLSSMLQRKVRVCHTGHKQKHYASLSILDCWKDLNILLL